MIGFGKDSIDSKMIGFLKQYVVDKDERFRMLEIYLRISDNLVLDSGLKSSCKKIDLECICYAKQRAYIAIVDNIRESIKERIELNKTSQIYSG